MELRFYPINDGNLYALALKLHATELLALHYDSKQLLEKQLIDAIKDASFNVAEEMKQKKMQNGNIDSEIIN